MSLPLSRVLLFLAPSHGGKSGLSGRRKSQVSTSAGRAQLPPLSLGGLCSPMCGAVLISLATGWASVHSTTSTGGHRWQETPCWPQAQAPRAGLNQRALKKLLSRPHPDPCAHFSAGGSPKRGAESPAAAEPALSRKRAARPVRAL